MYSYNCVIFPSGVTSADPLPVSQSEVQGTSGIVKDSAQEDTASVVDLSSRSGTSQQPLPVPHPESSLPLMTSEVITTQQFLMVPLPTAGASGPQTAAQPPLSTALPASSTALAPNGGVQQGQRQNSSDARASSSLERQRYRRDYHRQRHHRRSSASHGSSPLVRRRGRDGRGQSLESGHWRSPSSSRCRDSSRDRHRQRRTPPRRYRSPLLLPTYSRRAEHSRGNAPSGSERGRQRSIWSDGEADLIVPGQGHTVTTQASDMVIATQVDTTSSSAGAAASVVVAQASGQPRRYSVEVVHFQRALLLHKHMGIIGHTVNNDWDFWHATARTMWPDDAIMDILDARASGAMAGPVPVPESLSRFRSCFRYRSHFRFLQFRSYYRHVQLPVFRWYSRRGRCCWGLTTVLWISLCQHRWHFRPYFRRHLRSTPSVSTTSSLYRRRFRASQFRRTRRIRILLIRSWRRRPYAYIFVAFSGLDWPPWEPRQSQLGRRLRSRRLTNGLLLWVHEILGWPKHGRWQAFEDTLTGETGSLRKPTNVQKETRLGTTASRRPCWIFRDLLTSGFTASFPAWGRSRLHWSFEGQKGS